MNNNLIMGGVQDPNRYVYKISKGISISEVEEQEEDLFSKGYKKENGTYRKYLEEYANVEYLDIDYSVEEEINSPLDEYETTEINENIYTCKYYSIEQKGFFGFFKKLFHLKTTENGIDDNRYRELLELQAEGKIRNLEKIITPKSTKKRIQLTDSEFKKFFRTGRSIKFIKENVGFKTETLEVIKEERIKGEDLEDFKKDKKILNIDKIIIKELVDKILMDEVEVVKTKFIIYQPGVWSRRGNHQSGTIANFLVELEIEYISGYNPKDPNFYNKDEIEEQAIQLIQNDHGTTIYIRDRDDKRDGFKIEDNNI